MLGEFEFLLLAATVRIGDKAYGAAIREEVERTTNRCCSIGALYTTLDRLEAKGLIETWMGGATPERGGRAKRMVRITKDGLRAAAAFHDTIRRASAGLSWSLSTAGGRS